MVAMEIRAVSHFFSSSKARFVVCTLADQQLEFEIIDFREL